MKESGSFVGHLKTFISVTLIAVMVWLLAESKMVRTQTFEAQVVLTTVPMANDSLEEASLVVRQASRSTDGLIQSLVRTVSIEIEGSTSGIDRFSRRLQNRIELRIGREIPANPGMHTLDLRSILRDSADMAIQGVVISKVTPEVIFVQVDELVTREFPIRVDMPAGVELDGAPRTDPPTVRVVAPSSVLAGVDANEAVVRVEAIKLAQLAQGRRETIPDIAIEIAGIGSNNWATVIEPAHVDVFVTLHTLSETMRLDRLPVQVLIAPAEIGKWRVQIADADKDLVNIEISGPAAAIELLKSGAVSPRAFVMLGFEELERGVGSKPAQILGLPVGCRIESAEFTVNLQISRLVGANPASGEPVDE